VPDGVPVDAATLLTCVYRATLCTAEGTVARAIPSAATYSASSISTLRRSSVRHRFQGIDTPRRRPSEFRRRAPRRRSRIDTRTHVVSIEDVLSMTFRLHRRDRRGVRRLGACSGGTYRSL